MKGLDPPAPSQHWPARVIAADLGRSIHGQDVSADTDALSSSEAAAPIPSDRHEPLDAFPAAQVRNLVSSKRAPTQSQIIRVKGSIGYGSPLHVGARPRALICSLIVLQSAQTGGDSRGSQ